MKLLRNSLLLSVSLLGRSSALQATLTQRTGTLMMMSSSSSVPIIVDTQEAKSQFFKQHTTFAVVGASTDRDKFGNKVLRAYLANNKQAIPINKKQSSIEDVLCVPDLTSLCANGTDDISRIGVSIITPPGVTKLVLEEAYRLGLRQFMVQPGTIDKDTVEFINTSLVGARVIKGCVLVELGFKH